MLKFDADPLENPRITAPEIQCVHRAENIKGNNLSKSLEFFGLNFLKVLNKISIAIKSTFTVMYIVLSGLTLFLVYKLPFLQNK